MVEITTRQVEPDKPLFPIVKAEISDDEFQQSSDSDSDSYENEDEKNRI